VAALPVGLRE